MHAARLLEALGRRKIVRVGIVYLAGAWGLAQVVEFVVQNYDVSRRLLDVAILLLILGFPAILIIAWYHGEKGRQEVGRTEASLLLTLGVLAAVGTYQLSTATEVPEEGGRGAARPAATARPTDLGANSVAVLPFTNSTGLDSLDWLGPGVSDMLTSNLARQSELRVVSPQRLFEILQSEGRSETDRIPQDLALRVAGRSGAHRLVRGSVLGLPGDLVLDVQLIDLADGTVAAAERVRGGDAFALVDSVAARLVRHLAIRITSGLASRRSPLELTGDLEAYRDFLARVRERWREIGPDDTQGRWELAQLYALVPGREEERRAVLEEIVEIDPNSAPAYAELAELALVRGERREADSLLRRFTDLERDPARTAERVAAVREIAGDYDAARVGYRHLLKLRPDDAGALERLARTYLREDRPQEAREALQGFADAPAPRLRVESRLLAGDAYAWEGRFDEALEAYRSATALAQELGLPEPQAEGRRAEAALEEALSGRGTGSRLNRSVWTLLDLGQADRALVLIESAEELFQRDVGRLSPLDYHVLLYARARAYELLGARERAAAAYAEIVKRWGDALARVPQLRDAAERLAALRGG